MTIKSAIGKLGKAAGNAFTPRANIPRSDVQSAVEYVMDNAENVGTPYAPTSAEYLVKIADAGLSNERVVTDTSTITWDWGATGQAKANLHHLGIESLSDPGADRGLFWDDSEGAIKFFEASGGLGFVGGFLSVTDPDLAAIVNEASFAAGDLLYHDGSTLTRLPAGASGQVLRTLGAGSAPQWTTATGLGDLLSANNLSDIADAAAARGNLGLANTSTDNAIVRFDGTAGQTQNSTVTIGDDGTLVLPSGASLGVGVSPARQFHVQGSNAIWRLDRDADTVGLQFHRFPSGNFSTPWKGFLIGVNAVGSNDGTFGIWDYGTAVGGPPAALRLAIDNNGAVSPGANDGGSLGKSGTAWSDLFLADGSVINFNAGNVTITHSDGVLSLSGALALPSSSLALRFASAPTTGLSLATNGILFSGSGVGGVYVGQNGSGVGVLGMSAVGFLGFSSQNTPSGSTIDTALFRDAADTLAQRRGANAQAFRWYRTFTDASNYERGALQTGSGYVELAAETAGTGTDNIDIRLTPAGTGNVKVTVDKRVGATTGNNGIQFAHDLMVHITNGVTSLRVGENQTSPGVLNHPSRPYGWSTTAGSGTGDLFLYRDAANVLAQRNGTAAQSSNIYNTYTDASNYERGFLRWNANVLEIGTEAGGTGTTRGFALKFGTTSMLSWSGTDSMTLGAKVQVPGGSFLHNFTSGWQLSMGTGNSATSVLGGFLGSNFAVTADKQFVWTSVNQGSSQAGVSADTGLKRVAASIVSPTDGTTGAGAFQLAERTAPAAPAANNAIIYAEDDGAANTRLMALFPTGAAVQLAKQGQNALLASIAALTFGTDSFIYGTGTDTAAAGTITSFGRSLVDDADAATARGTLGLVIGTNVQAYDGDLAALAALAGTGIAVRTGTDTWAQRTITGPAAGLTVSNGNGVSGNPTLALANDLAALEGLGSTGLAARTGSDTWAQRSIQGTANEVAVANGDGVAGNPTVSLPSSLTFTGKTITGGNFSSPAAITGLPDPTNAQDAATKGYVDSVAAGLDVKPSVKCATTSNITLSGTQTIDGVSAGAGDRVLVKNQTTQAQNGIYVVAAGAWSRATDMDAWGEVPGSFVFVEQGATYADTAWVCTADQGGTLGTTAITWSQFAGAGTYTAGTGLSLTGTQFAISDPELLALAGLTSAADALPYFTGSGTAATTTLTSFARTLLDDADAATMRSTLGLVIGSNVQAFDATLAALAGLTITQGSLIYGTGTDAFAVLAKDTNATRYLANTGTNNNPAWAQVDLTNGVTGDLPFSNLAQIAGLSVLGVAGNVTADVAAITAANDNEVLRRSGSSIGFGTIATGGIANDAVTYAKMQNVTGSRLLGNPSGSAADPSEISLNSSLEFSGTSLQRAALTGAISASAGSNTTTSTIGLEIVIDGGGSAITTGVKGDMYCPFGFTITEWTILADQSGSIVIDIWKDSRSNYPPTVADSITASAKPTLSSATNAQSATLTGWTTTVSAGDTLRFNVDSASTVTRVTLLLKVTKTS